MGQQRTGLLLNPTLGPLSRSRSTSCLSYLGLGWLPGTERRASRGPVFAPSSQGVIVSMGGGLLVAGSPPPEKGLASVKHLTVEYVPAYVEFLWLGLVLNVWSKNRFPCSFSAFEGSLTFSLSRWRRIVPYSFGGSCEETGAEGDILPRALREGRRASRPT